MAWIASKTKTSVFMLVGMFDGLSGHGWMQATVGVKWLIDSDRHLMFYAQSIKSGRNKTAFLPQVKQGTQP